MGFNSLDAADACSYGETRGRGEFRGLDVGKDHVAMGSTSSGRSRASVGRDRLGRVGEELHSVIVVTSVREVVLDGS